jgi:dihydropyrimidine dehydrogenase (NAD+) subunit PreT
LKAPKRFVVSENPDSAALQAACVFSAIALRARPDVPCAGGEDTWLMKTASPAPQALFEELSTPLSRQEAIVEADRCLECGGLDAEAPCVTGCPAGVDVPAFVTAIARDEPTAAAQVIFAENLLGGTCARVCPVEILCEGACVLPHEGRAPIEIGRLQRFAAEHALGRGEKLRSRAPYNWFRIAVIGAGPAGLACAGELGARGYTVTVYDERPEPGGLARYGIAPYRQQQEPLPAETRLLAELGVSFELGIAIDSPEALAYIEDEADAVVLAVGMGADADISYPGDELPGVWESLPFIEALKTGAPPEVGEAVAVIGGGNTAIDVAREAVRLGARDVRLLYRRTQAEMPAYPHEVEEMKDEGVEPMWLTAPTRFLGNGRLQGVECRRLRLGKPDASGRPRPEEVSGTDFVVPADTAVKAIGQRPRARFLGWVDGLELDRGLIRVDPETGQTGNSKYFAAGDATNGGATVVEAVRQAKIAAAGIDEWLAGGRRLR